MLKRCGGIRVIVDIRVEYEKMLAPAPYCANMLAFITGCGMPMAFMLAKIMS